MTGTSDERVSRTAREIQHGIWLASQDSEDVWGWGTQAGRLRAARRARLIADGARLGSKSRVLEIGCGTGLFTELFAATGADIVAVDVSDALLGRARARAIPSGRTRFTCGRFEDLDLPGAFDAAIGSSVLHHLDLDEALRQLRRLVRPGGFISFAEPNMLNPQVFLERHIRSLFKYVSPDETAFTRRALARRLRQAGFVEIKIVPFDWLHPATPAPLIPVISAIGRVLERIPLVREFAGSLAIACRRP